MLKLLVPRVRLFSTVVQAINHVQEASLNEKCILVNEKDKAVGQASKRDCHMKRSSTKVTFPDHITNTCCSHPLFDINDERIEPGALGVKLAAIRRLEFELGISQNLVAPEDLHYITRILYKSIGDGNWGEHEIDYILLIKKDLPVKPNPDEVSKVFYVPRDDFSDYMDKLKDPVTPWFKLVSNNGLKTWWDNIHRIDQYKDHVTIHRLSTSKTPLLLSISNSTIRVVRRCASSLTHLRKKRQPAEKCGIDNCSSVGVTSAFCRKKGGYHLRSKFLKEGQCDALHQLILGKKDYHVSSKFLKVGQI